MCPGEKIRPKADSQVGSKAQTAHVGPGGSENAVAEQGERPGPRCCRASEKPGPSLALG